MNCVRFETEQVLHTAKKDKKSFIFKIVYILNNEQWKQLFSTSTGKCKINLKN